MTIKTRFILLGLCVLVALGVVSGITYFNNADVKKSIQTQSLRAEQLRMAEEMKFAATELVLAGMDSIVDRVSGEVAPELVGIMNRNARFIQDNIQELVEASDTQEEREAMQVVAQKAQVLIKAITVDLVKTIRTSAARVGEIEAEFARTDDVIDEMGSKVENNLVKLEKSMEARFGETEEPLVRLDVAEGLIIVKNMHVAQINLVLAAMDSIIDRHEGKVSDERQDIMRDSVAILEAESERLLPYLGTAEEEAMVAEIKAGIKGLDQAIRVDLVQLVSESGKEALEIEERFAAIDDDIDASADVVAKQLDIVADSINGEVLAAGKASSTSIQDASDLTVAVSVVVCLLIVVVIFLFSRSILLPLNVTVDFAGQIAEGQLDHELEISGENEIGKLAHALRTMVASLKDMIATSESKTLEAEANSQRANEAMEEARQALAAAEEAKAEGLREAAARVEAIVGELYSSSEELSAQVAQVSQGSAIQSERIRETATAMEEMNATVLEVARNASQAAESADQSRERAVGGAQIVKDVVTSINKVHDQAVDMQSGLAELGLKADNIGQIMTVITDIADQTNLLALNAAIEAARAGDAGRGFAVVADEVRKLAEKTMGATKEVGEAVAAIQGESHKAVGNMNLAAESVDSCNQLAQQAGDALVEIVELVDNTSEQVQSIATASEQQSATSEEINSAVDDINRISDETAQGMGQAEASIHRMSEMAGSLAELTEQLRQG